MNSFVQRNEILQRRQARPGHSSWSAIISIAIVLSGVLWLGAIGPTCWAAEAQLLPHQSGEPPPLRRGAGQPPIPVPLPGQNVVQFYNQSPVTLLLGVFGPNVVKTREGTWELPPQQWLTLDVPASWDYTIQKGSAGVRFWARTGCRYDKDSDIAQCETGDCGGKYDCSAAHLAGVAPTTLAEFCFNCAPLTDPPASQPPSPPLPITLWDVSAVDGVNLSMDITPLGPHSATNPFSPGDVFWCKFPDAVPGADLRGTNPQGKMYCPSGFQLKRSDLSSFVRDAPKNPDGIIACFSNCGKYEYPTAPSANCPASDPTCAAWKQYCCQAGTYDPKTGEGDYGKPCSKASDCSDGDACWHRPGVQAVCACRGFIVGTSCPPDVCTNENAPAAEPPFGHCSQTAASEACIGDDTVHEVLRRAYTWPNDPQTYDCNTSSFRVTFAPGGTPVPITESGDVEPCSNLPPAYGYATAKMLCSGVTGKVFAGARLPSVAPGVWDCNVTGATTGVLCRW